MKYKVPNEEIKELINKLLEHYTIEEIGVAMKRSAQAVWAWRRGRNSPSYMDYEALKKLLTKKELVVK
jgi:hypothetical protein